MRFTDYLTEANKFDNLKYKKRWEDFVKVNQRFIDRETEKVRDSASRVSDPKYRDKVFKRDLSELRTQLISWWNKQKQQNEGFVGDYTMLVEAAMHIKAKEFAKKAHKGQWRKFSGEPYVEHPKRVAKYVEKLKKSHRLEDLVTAANLHDTIEDTDVTADEIEKLFGSLVASLVKELSSDGEGIKQKGKSQYLADKMIDMSSWGLVIKLADRLDNISDLHRASVKFREKYVKETNFILRRLSQERKLTRTHKKLINIIQRKLKEYGDM